MRPRYNSLNGKCAYPCTRKKIGQRRPSLDAQFRDAVVRVDHALEPNTALITAPAGSTLRVVPTSVSAASAATSTSAAATAATGLATILAWGATHRGRLVGNVAAYASRPRPPRNHVSLQRALHDGRVVNAHAGADGPALDANGVEVVVSPPLAVDAPRDFRGARRAREVGYVHRIHATSSGASLAVIATHHLGRFVAGATRGSDGRGEREGVVSASAVRARGGRVHGHVL